MSQKNDVLALKRQIGSHVSGSIKKVVHTYSHIGESKGVYMIYKLYELILLPYDFRMKLPLAYVWLNSLPIKTDV